MPLLDSAVARYDAAFTQALCRCSSWCTLYLLELTEDAFKLLGCNPTTSVRHDNLHSYVMSVTETDGLLECVTLYGDAPALRVLH